MPATLIEFYDKSSRENIVNSLALKPRKVIFLGSNKKQMKRQIQIYLALFSKRGIEAECDCCIISKNDLPQIQETLSTTICENPDCVIDLTGEDEISLVAVGTVAGTLKARNISFHRVNINTRKVIEFFDDSIVDGYEEPSLTVVENIELHGGAVVFDNSRENFTKLWDISDKFKRDIEKMWAVCKEDCGEWNTLISALSDWIDPGSLEIVVTGIRDGANPNTANGNAQPWHWCRKFFYKLQTEGVISGFSYDDYGFSFVSKNGEVSDDELYKLNTVAERFGGEYSKKVLIAPYIDKRTDALAYFRQRAADIDIYLYRRRTDNDD